MAPTKRSAASRRRDQAVLATMHRKERVIAPVLERFLGLQVAVVGSLDTDAFGTFSREVERTGTQLDAARAKIAAGFELAPWARVGLSSEGSFGPHPSIPFLPLGREIVVLIDRGSGLELVGHHAGYDTNFSHPVVSGLDQAHSFAERIGFPGHGLIVMGCLGGGPAPEVALIKDVTSWDTLERSHRPRARSTGAAFVETDMRAHRNPRRMRAIKRATIDLVRPSRSLCPVCSQPGFAITERLSGLPCSWCGEPTHLTKAEVLICAGCGY